MVNVGLPFWRTAVNNLADTGWVQISKNGNYKSYKFEMKTHNGEKIDGTDVLGRITAHRAKFLSFLTARVHDPETAEDILQSAYVKAVEHGATIRRDESTVAWFYRILRNAIVDHYRRSAARERAHEAFVVEGDLSYELEIERTVCSCIGEVILDLKSEYRTAIEQVDIAGSSVDVFARAEQISLTNASVRLHRARKKVAKELIAICGICAEHKCLDCTCRPRRV